MPRRPSQSRLGAILGMALELQRAVSLGFLPRSRAAAAVTATTYRAARLGELEVPPEAVEAVAMRILDSEANDDA